MKNLLLIAMLLIVWQANAQVGINDDNSAPDPSAMLDVRSSDKGFLPPRMTTAQMNSIVAPVAGLLVYNTSVNALYWYDGTNWQQFNEFNFVEQDPVFALHPASSITNDLLNDWNTAYGWGNHALAGYLTSYTETDPLFYAHPASWISAGDINNWNQAYANRLVSVHGSTPLSLQLQNNQLTGSIQPASAVQSGYLTANDWNTFNNKQSQLTFGHVTSPDMVVTGGNNAVYGNGLNLTINKGNLSETYSSVLTITGGANAVLGTGTTIRVNQATSSQSGYLSSADWNTFNNKQNALTFGNLTSSDITVTGGSSAVKGGGATLSVKKGNLTESGSSVLTITNGSNAVLGTSGTSLQVKQAGASQSGYLSSGDWNSFNDKVSSQWTANGTKLHYNTGNVGIGTSNPQSKVDIAGNAVIGDAYSGLITGPANGLAVEGKLGVGTPTPVSSASLEISSTTTGVLLPRMTRAQRNAIATPADGLMVYCLNCGTNGALSIFTNGTWLTFSPCNTQSPITGIHQMSLGQVVWTWQEVNGAVGYKWNTVADFETATDLGAVITKTETGTQCDTTYTRYIWAYSNCGESVMTAIFTTVPATPPETPVEGIHTATQTSITWNWSPVSGASGYKWNIVNDFASAIDMGTNTTYTETGDTCGAELTRFVWAYNGCGISTVNTITQATLPCWLCGYSVLTIAHETFGGVAPVNKTTSYGTVTNIPGEPTKCWIAKNLGASQQATTVNDATEVAAGWYWKFNRKQGYKHDGSSSVPSWTTASVNENSAWLTTNDPCNLELGTVWRLPSYSEWFNVDNSGGWSNWSGPWSSDLKLHASGNIIDSNGSLDNRGSIGYFWSATQNTSAYGWDFQIGSGISSMTYNNKAHGFAIRCLRDN